MRKADETFVVVRTGPKRGLPAGYRGGPRSGGRLGKPVGGAVVVGDDEPVGQEGGQGAHRLLGVASTTGGPRPGPGSAGPELSSLDALPVGGRAQAGHHQPPGLAVGAVPGLAAASARVDVRGAAGRQPGAAGLPRAGPAIRLAGGAHQGAELHDGH